MKKIIILFFINSLFAAGGGHQSPAYSFLHAIPFIGILLSIAIIPLINHHFWEHNFGKISLFWALSFIIPFYLLVHSFSVVFEVLLHTLTFEYIPFIFLLLALFTVSGGICLKGSLVGTPILNLMLLALMLSLQKKFQRLVKKLVLHKSIFQLINYLMVKKAILEMLF